MALALGIVLLFDLWLIFVRPASRIDALLRILAGALLLFTLYAMRAWWVEGFYPLVPAVLLYVAGVIVAIVRLRRTLLPRSRSGWTMLVVDAALLAVAIYLVRPWIGGLVFTERPVHLSFPFRNGVYVVIGGGNGAFSPAMNYHYTSSTHQGAGTNRSMKYATDIEKLAATGRSVRPGPESALGSYVIWGETIYSPCDGTVVEAVDGLPDEVPHSGAPPYTVGNHVTLLLDDVYIVMGHMEPGSVRVRVGDTVRTGQPLGIVGNSGWTSEPHLHMQAARGSIWNGDGVPMIFDGWFLFRNSLFVRLP